VNGYGNLAQLFKKSRDYDQAENIQFLESAMSALRGFILDNNHSTVIQDYDAFQILLNLISGTNDVAVILQALSCLGMILRTDWKNVVFSVRMNGIGHLAHLIWRVARSRALPLDSFTIGILSSFSKLNEGLAIDDNLRITILDKASEVFNMISVIYGVMNIDPEIIYAEFACSHFLQNDTLAPYFLETLFALLESKIEKYQM